MERPELCADVEAAVAAAGAAAVAVVTQTRTRTNTLRDAFLLDRQHMGSGGGSAKCGSDPGGVFLGERYCVWCRTTCSSLARMGEEVRRPD